MKKIIIGNVTLELKKKTLLDKVMSKDEAYEYFATFLREYVNLDEYPKELAGLDKSEFIDIILSNYTISTEESFIKHSNAFIARRNTLVGYMIGILSQLDYKLTDVIKLTPSELFEVFTYEVHGKICQKKPEVAQSIISDLISLGISKETATTYINNGIPSGAGKIEQHTPRNTTDEEDIKELFKNLK
ncbi:MAG: hypothetical protein ACRCX2_05050 [Paraclostridium sp.]